MSTGPECVYVLVDSGLCVSSLWMVLDVDLCSLPHQAERGACNKTINSSLFWPFKGKLGHHEFLDMKLSVEFYSTIEHVNQLVGKLGRSFNWMPLKKASLPYTQSRKNLLSDEDVR